MNRSRGPVIFFLILAAGAILAIVLHLAGRESSRDTENPNDYDLSPYTATPSNIPRWKELRRIPIGAESVGALAVDTSGRIYVLAEGRILILSAEGKTLGGSPAPAGANCLSVDGDLFVGCGDHVEVLSTNGKPLAVWSAPDTKTFLTGLSAKGSDVWGVDFTSRHIWHWDRSGKLLGIVAARDEGGQRLGLVLPSAQCDVAASPDGTVWVANTGRLRLEEYHRDGRLLGGWGSAGMGLSNFPGCCNPVHFALVPGVGFATGEKGILRAKIFSPDGRLLAILAGHEDFDSGSPAPAVAADETGRVFLLDYKRKMVRVYARGDARGSAAPVPRGNPAGGGNP